MSIRRRLDDAIEYITTFPALRHDAMRTKNPEILRHARVSHTEKLLKPRRAPRFEVLPRSEFVRDELKHREMPRVLLWQTIDQAKQPSFFSGFLSPDCSG